MRERHGGPGSRDGIQAVLAGERRRAAASGGVRRAKRARARTATYSVIASAGAAEPAAR
jgi:hypothetical protein